MVGVRCGRLLGVGEGPPLGAGWGRGWAERALLSCCILIGIGILLATGLAGLIGCQKTDGLLDPAGGDASSVLHAAYRSDADFEDNPIVLDGQAIDTEWGGVGTGIDLYQRPRLRGPGVGGREAARVRRHEGRLHRPGPVPA